MKKRKKRRQKFRFPKKVGRLRFPKMEGKFRFPKKVGQLHFPKREEILCRAADMKGIVLWAVEIFAVCLLAWVLVSCFGQRVSNAGDSMKPVLTNGNIVLVDRVIYNVRAPKRGEVIAFKPDGNENAHYSVKRVVGLPGETVQIRDGQVYIDGEAVKKDIFVSDIRSAGIADEPVELGENEYFVMGDNHTGSNDSRMADVGNVRRKDIFGRVWFAASPGENFGFVKR